MKPLPKNVTGEIRSILEGCRDGRLKHNQRVFHCGTAHCIAGWKQALDFAKACNVKNIARVKFAYETDTPVGKYAACFEKWSTVGASTYAQEQWGLTYTEARILFNGLASFPGQFALLEQLERGERVK